MTVEPISSERLAEVVRLSVLLSERVLDALIMKQPVTADEAVALAKAARLLQDQGVEWPPLLMQAVHSLAAEENAPPPKEEPSNALANVVTGGLSRLFTKTRPQSEQL